ncbi:MAG: glycosyltransferase [Verrucomicrobiia bacterium]
MVLPAFDAVQTLPRALRSLQAQSLASWELIVVDDGSADGTLGLANGFAADDPRISVISRSHGGIVSALNSGLAQARAPFIARMDADDEAHPERLALQAEYLNRHPEIGLVGCLVDFGGDRASAGGYALHVDWINQLVAPENISLQRFVESPFAHPSVMFRRELVEPHGGYRESDFPEDYELWLRWLDAGVRMAKVPRALLTWHDSPGRLSRRSLRYRPDAFYQCKAVYLARWLRTNVDPWRRVLVWGAGRPTRKRAAHLLAHGVAISGYIDIDPRKIGRELGGLPVIGPEEIPAAESCFVLGYVGKRGARELARTHLQSRGFVEGRDFLMAA